MSYSFFFDSKTSMNYLKTLSFFWQHIKPYKGYYIVMLLAPIYSAFFYFFYNYAVKLFIDRMVHQEATTLNNLIAPVVLFLGANFLLDVFWRISAVAEWKSEPYVRRSIILSTYNYTQNHSIKFFQDNFTGSISSKLKGILDGYDKFWAEMHHGFLSRILAAIVSICALTIVNINLGIFMIFWCLVYGAILYRLSIKLNTCAQEETESRHTIFGQIADKISNIFSIFSFAAKNRELKAIDNEIKKEFIPKQINLYKESFKLQLVAGALYFGMFTFLLFYMIHLRFIGKVSLGDFALVFGLSSQVAESIWQATQSLQDFSRAMGDLKSSLSIINLPHQDQDPKNAKKLKIKSPSIVFHNVDFSYGDNHTLFKNLNLHIKAFEKIGLVGQTGAGKSSLISLLLRYFKPNHGEILIDHTDISFVTANSLWAHIALIPQDVQLFHRTIYDNIAFGKPNADKEQVIYASKHAHIHDFIMTLPHGYDTFVGERGVKLSGGQRQRISIARAILKDAPILVLDEATSSLDSQTEKLIQESLNFIMDKGDKTVIAVAHRLATLKSLDRILVLHQGQIIEQGSHDDLIAKKSHYQRLWSLQEI